MYRKSTLYNAIQRALIEGKAIAKPTNEGIHQEKDWGYYI